MTIPYTYKVLSSDLPAKCMVVEYSAVGYPTLQVGLRLPVTGVDVKTIIEMYAPTAQWYDSTLVYQDVTVGLEGSVPHVETSLDTVKAAKLTKLADWRYVLETSGVTVEGVTVSTSRQSQAQLTATYANLKDGLISSVEWKQPNGSFVTLDAAQMGAVVAAVALHVQTSFTSEKMYSEQIKACTTVAEVDAITLP
jgi:hypothetical protein